MIGASVGAVCAISFLSLLPHLPNIFADAFFYPKEKALTIVQDTLSQIEEKFSEPLSNQYFIYAVDDTVSTSTKVVHADIGTMKLALYEEGQKIKEYDIQSVGREGTAWQTPIGTFDMSYKKENHFSSIGHVWMPYSMHFFGNYFIHGWPYYSDGSPVARGYSGGCLRLNTPDVQEVYAFVDKDTQLILSTNKEIETLKDFEYTVQLAPPIVESKYVIADLKTGEVVASHKSKEIIQAGSFTKLMTGLISLETLNQYQEAVLNQEIVQVSDVLYALLLEDNDEAGALLFEHKNKNQYLKDMNMRAESLAMNTTVYKDVNGDIKETVSTLEDVFKLIQYIDMYKPFMFKVLSLDTYKSKGTEFTSSSIHPLKKDAEYVAGFVDSNNEDMITVFDVEIKKENSNDVEKKTFVFILQSENFSLVDEDTKILKSWLTSSVVMRAK